MEHTCVLAAAFIHTFEKGGGGVKVSAMCWIADRGNGCCMCSRMSKRGAGVTVTEMYLPYIFLCIHEYS